MKRNPQDLALRNLHAQQKINAQVKAQIAKLTVRVSEIERALRAVLKTAGR